MMLADPNTSTLRIAAGEGRGIFRRPPLPPIHPILPFIVRRDNAPPRVGREQDSREPPRKSELITPRKLRVPFFLPLPQVFGADS